MTTGGPRSQAWPMRADPKALPTFAELSSQPRVTLRVLEATQDESTSFPLNSMCFGWCSLMSENPISCKRVRFESANEWMDAANSVQYRFRLRELAKGVRGVPQRHCSLLAVWWGAQAAALVSGGGLDQVRSCVRVRTRVCACVCACGWRDSVDVRVLACAPVLVCACCAAAARKERVSARPFHSA